MLAEGALDVPPLLVGHGRKVSPKRVSVGRPGWPLGGVVRVKRDHVLAHAEFLGAKAMVVLGIVAGIRQCRIEADQFRGLPDGRDETAGMDSIVFQIRSDRLFGPISCQPGADITVMVQQL